MVDWNEYMKAHERREQRKAAEANRLREIEIQKKAILNPPDPRILSDINHTLESQERELKHIAHIRRTDLARYWSENLGARELELLST